MLGSDLVMDVSEAFLGLLEPLVLQKVSFSNAVNGNSVMTITETINFMGVIRPPKPKELELLPEGYRSWAVKKIHTTTLYNVNTGDQIIISKYPNTVYKVLGRKDNASYSFYTYFITEQFQSI